MITKKEAIQVKAEIRELQPDWLYKKAKTKHDIKRYIQSHTNKPRSSSGWYSPIQRALKAYTEIAKLINKTRPHWNFRKNGPVKKISVGDTFGSLTVIGVVDRHHGRSGRFSKCRCSCGSVRISTFSNLNSSSTCGCSRIKHKMAPGDKHFDLTVIRVLTKRSPDGKRRVFGLCKCGEKTVVLVERLVKGLVKSCGCRRFSSRKSIDKGDIFGSISVVKEVSPGAQGQRRFQCKCKCGKSVVRKIQSLKTGASCGCVKRGMLLPGQQFYRLKVIKDFGCTKVHVACYCGKKTYTTRGNLLRGKTKSCGCLKRDNSGRPRVQIQAGEKFGYLTALQETVRIRDERAFLCQCICGRTTSLSVGRLRSGHTKSCGCRGIGRKVS